MARAEDYAAWIVANKDKQGTPEFETVAKAYQLARSQGAQPAQRQEAPEPSVGRSLGLTARYGIEGVTAGAGTFTDPVIMAIGGAVRAATGSDYDPATLASIGRNVADALGLPQPETSTERVVGALARGVAGGASSAATASQVANVARGTTQAVAKQMAAQPAMQAASGGAAGAAGQVVAENDGGTGAQLAASLAAGAAVPASLGAAQRTMQIANGSPAPAQQKLLDAAAREQVPIATSDALPPDTFLGKHAQAVTERIPLAGTGGMRAAQQEARQGAVARIADEYGAPSYEAIVSSIKGKVGSIKRAAGAVIDKTGQKLDAVGAVTPTKSVAAIDNAIAKLENPNVFSEGAKGQIERLRELKDVLSNGQQTFTTLRQSRTAVKDMLDGVDPSGRSQLPTFTKKLVGDVYGAMKSDMDDFARANLTAKESEKLARANAVYGNEAQLLRQSRLKNVLDKGDVTPEVVRNMIYSNKLSENKILYDSLSQSGRTQVKAALISDAAEKATTGDFINPNKFGSELAKHDKKLDVFFKGEERERIQGLMRVLQVTRRAQDAAVAPTTTGATLLPYALGGAVTVNPAVTIAGAITAGRLARLYESEPVRNALLKIANTPRGSSEEAKYLRAIAAAVTASNQQQTNNRKEQLKPAF